MKRLGRLLDYVFLGVSCVGRSYFMPLELPAQSQ